jgi:HSP20 family protein
MGEKKAKEEKEERGEARSVTPWRPFGELESWPDLFGEWPMSGRLPRLLDELFREWPRAGRAGAFLPAMDVSENEKRYTITVEIPGVKREDVQVELEDGVLTIRGEKSSEREEKKERSRYAERSYGSFRRSFRLPSDADAEQLEAAFKDGVLTITLRKTEQAKPRTIAIKSA